MSHRLTDWIMRLLGQRAGSHLTRKPPKTLRVWEALVRIEDRNERPWGMTVAKESGIGPATLYPLLRRLERAGFLESYDEFGIEGSDRPPRTYFRILRAPEGGRLPIRLTPRDSVDTPPADKTD